MRTFEYKIHFNGLLPGMPGASPKIISNFKEIEYLYSAAKPFFKLTLYKKRSNRKIWQRINFKKERYRIRNARTRN